MATPSKGVGRGFGSGGPRPGGGRPKGSINHQTRAVIAEARASGKMLPLDFLLAILNDDNAPMRERLYCAATAAPYCHARLIAQPVAYIDPNKMSDAELLESIRRLEQQVAEAGAEAPPYNEAPGAVIRPEAWQPPALPVRRPDGAPPAPAPEPSDQRHLRFDPRLGKMVQVTQ